MVTVLLIRRRSKPHTCKSSRKTSTGVLVDLSNIARIAVGENHVLALSTDGYVYAWGNNSNGQLGNGDTSSTNEKFHDNDTTDGIYAAQKVYRGESAATNDDWYIKMLLILPQVNHSALL